MKMQSYTDEVAGTTGNEQRHCLWLLVAAVAREQGMPMANLLRELQQREEHFNRNK